MNMSRFREGLNILSKYFDNPDGHHLGAEHDTFYVYSTDSPVSVEDVKRLVDLGWFQEDVDYDDGEEDFSVKHYNPKNGWVAYV